MTDQIPLERRRHDREPVVKPCKVRDRRGLLFCAGVTTDYCPGGVLMKIDSSRCFSPGDEVDFAAAWDQTAVIPTSGLVRGTVRRVLPIDHHHQAIAIQFGQEQQALQHAA